jgi:hypothetical protein
VSATLGTGDLSGYGQLFGMSALNGGTEQYLDMFRLYKNFSMNSMLEGQVFGNVLAFTPVLESQIEAGRRRGGGKYHLWGSRIGKFFCCASADTVGCWCD